MLPAERLGTVLANKYRLDRLVGQGGMGAVIAGEHLLTGRAVAVKLLHPDPTGSRTLLPRFRQEARAAAALDHPNVVSILDVGETDDGAAFMVQELLRGRTLKSRIADSGPLAHEELADLLLPLLHALGVAHGRGIVHRDLKPDNVFLAEDAMGRVTPKLLDFGIAKVTGSSLATAQGLIVGTPEYMSPEQACGSSNVGAASDVWSMGVVAYECLSGALPFEPSDDAWGTLNAVRTCEPIPVSERAPWLPRATCEVVMRALARDPGSRWRDAREFHRALAAATGRAGVAADPAIDPAGVTLELDETSIDSIPPAIAQALRGAKAPLPTTAWNEPALGVAAPPTPRPTEPWEPVAAQPDPSSATTPARQGSTPFAWAPAPARPPKSRRSVLVLGIVGATVTAAFVGSAVWVGLVSLGTSPTVRPARTPAPRATPAPAPIVAPPIVNELSPPIAPRTPVASAGLDAAAPSAPPELGVPVVVPTDRTRGTRHPRDGRATSASATARAPVVVPPRIAPPSSPAAPVRVAPVPASTPRVVPMSPQSPRPSAPVVIDNGIQVPR